MQRLFTEFNELSFLIFDFETEGLNNFYNKPWEVYFQANKGDKILEKHLYYLKWPDLKVSEEAARITGFNHQKIQDLGRDPREILDIFDSYLYNENYLIVGANILGFDSMVHNGWRAFFNKNTDYSWLKRLMDTNILAKQYLLKLQKPQDLDYLTWHFKLHGIVKRGLKTGIDGICKTLQIPVDQALRHKAEYDCFLTFQIFKNLIYKLEV